MICFFVLNITKLNLKMNSMINWDIRSLDDIINEYCGKNGSDMVDTPQYPFNNIEWLELKASFINNDDEIKLKREKNIDIFNRKRALLPSRLDLNYQIEYVCEFLMFIIIEQDILISSYICDSLRKILKTYYVSILLTTTVVNDDTKKISVVRLNTYMTIAYELLNKYDIKI